MQRLLIVLGGVVVLALVAFVMFRVRHQPPPPPPLDAVVLVPARSLGPFTVGMSQAEAEAKKTTQKLADDATVIAEWPCVARLRDGKVTTVSAVVPPAGISLNGQWIRQATHAAETARALAAALGNCVAHRKEPEGLGGWSGPWFDCRGTRIEADDGREQVTIVVGAP